MQSEKMNPRLLITFTVMLLSQSVLLAFSPLVTDDADTVEAGKLQLNCDFQFVRTGSTSLYSATINPVLGLTPRLELGAVTMAVGTAAGGWRIIRTLGNRMVKLQPVHGFAAETSAAMIIQAASYYGIPLSTTHVISTSIMGVGAVKRFSGMRWVVVERIIWAWLFTLPASGLIGYALARAAAAL